MLVTMWFFININREYDEFSQIVQLQMTVKKIPTHDFRFIFKLDRYLCTLRLVLNFETLIRKISIFIVHKLQKNVKFSKFYHSPNYGLKILKMIQNMYHTNNDNNVHNVWEFQNSIFNISLKIIKNGINLITHHVIFYINYMLHFTLF